MTVILGIVIGHAGVMGMDIRTTQFFRADFLTRGRLDQRRPA